MNESEILQALKEGKPVRSEDLITLRSRAMHEIRFELILRLMHRGESLTTISVYWEDEHEFMLTPHVENKIRKLVFGRAVRRCVEFPDLWLLCYLHDAAITDIVNRELDRIADAAVGKTAAESGQAKPPARKSS